MCFSLMEALVHRSKVGLREPQQGNNMSLNELYLKGLRIH